MGIKTSISTDMIDNKLRTKFWRTVLDPVHKAPVDDDNGDGLSKDTNAVHMSSIQIGTTKSNLPRNAGPPKIAYQNAPDHYLLQVITAGDLKGNFNGVDVIAQQGDIVVIDLSQPFSNQVDTGSRIAVFIPRDELEKNVGWPNMHGQVMRSSNPSTRLLFEYLRSLQAISGELNIAEAHSAQEAMLTLFGASIAGSEGGTAERQPTKVSTRKCVLAYIDANLADPQLGPQSIIQNFRISRSQLYRIFDNDGGVAKVIRDKRLDRAYYILVSHNGKPLSFKEIAYRCGFQDGTQFTKAFKARFCMSPKDVKASSAPHIPGSNFL